MGNQLLLDAPALAMPVAPKPIQEQMADQRPPSIGETLGSWSQFLMSGQQEDLPELIEFLFKSYYITPMQDPVEMMFLGEAIQELRPKCLVEIGTGQGGTLFFLTRVASRRSTIISMDLPEGRTGAYSLRRQLLYECFRRRGQKVRLLRGDTHLAWMVRHLKGLLGEQQIDFLFIDGDRSYAGVKQDFETYGPLVRQGGVIAFHDIMEGERKMVGDMPKFWSEIKSQYRHSEIVNDPSQSGFGIGLLHVDEPIPETKRQAFC